jgi:alpha-galactosidase
VNIQYITNNPFLFKGWNSWNHYQCHINEKLIQQTTDVVVASGLAAAGYEYRVFFDASFIISLICFFLVNMDDCWQGSRDAQGVIQSNPIDFPSGIAALADYVHARKLKFGLYSGTKISIIYRREAILLFSICQMQEPSHVRVELVHWAMKL